MTSLAKEFWQTMLAQGIGIGIGTGLIFLPALSVISQYFLKRRSLALGIVTTGSSVGGEYDAQHNEIMLTYRYLLANHAQQPDRIAWFPKSSPVQRVLASRCFDTRLRSCSPTIRPRQPPDWANEETVSCRALQVKAIHPSRRRIVLCRMGSILSHLLHPLVHSVSGSS
jgi:hypothetical protein